MPSPEKADADRRVVTYHLPGGDRRRVPVTDQELEELRARGEPAASAVAELARRLIGPAGWVLALILSAVLVPAITQQWNDRRQELEVKTAIVRDLGESAATAISNARFLGASALPEAHAVNVVCRPDKLGSEEGRERCADEERNEALATARMNMETRTGWRKAGASLQARVATYYPGDEDDWARYSDAVERFLRLPTSTCGRERDENARELLAYLEEDVPRDPRSSRWAPLFGLSERECRSATARAARAGYKERTDELSDRLLAERTQLLRSIRAANTEGFSTTLSDLIGNVWWALVLGVMLAGFPVWFWLKRLSGDG